MTKYWNKERVRRDRERKARAEKVVGVIEHQRSFTPGDIGKNAELMLDALGLQLRRRIVARLKRGGAMSVSKLVEPFRITLPSALAHVRLLERSGIITTHKRGRIRFCVYNPRALEELSKSLTSTHFG